MNTICLLLYVLSFQVCKEEKEAGACAIPFSAALERASLYTGLSYRTIVRIQNGKPKEQFKPRTKRIKLDDFDKDVIRRTIHELIVSKKVVPNVSILLEELRERIGYNGKRESLRLTLHDLGFRWKATRSNRKILMERTDIVNKRIQFLRKVKEYRDAGRTIVYTDETYVHTNHSVKRSWQCEDTGLKVPFSKGERYVIVHAGTVNGFIEGASLVFKSKTKSGDYHDEMNSQNFMKWLQERLIPNLPPNSVLVVDNAPYHNKQDDKCPTTATRKADIQAWLTRNDISFGPNLLKAELLELCKTNRPEPQYILDNLMKEHGHNCLRLPPYHADLNAIEMIWAKVKGHIARQNLSFKSSEMVKLIENGIQSVTEEQWRNCCNHVCKEEERYWASDIAVEAELERLVICVDSSDNDTDTASEEDDYSDTDTADETV